MKDTVRDENKIGFSVISANVYMYNNEFQKLIDLVIQEQPDLLLLLETNQEWADGVEELNKDYPYHIFHPLENTYGMLFYSKCPITESEVRFLLKDEIPSIKANIKISDHQILCFYVVHPEPPAPEESDTSEPRDIELLKVAKEVKDRDDLILVTGDLNDVAWSHTTRLFRRFSGLLDPRIGRGTFNTFHAKYPLMRWPLDHFFFSKQFTLDEMRVLSGIGSDHFPMFIKVSLDSLTDQEQPSPDQQDKQEVEEQLKEDRHYE